MTKGKARPTRQGVRVVFDSTITSLTTKAEISEQGVNELFAQYSELSNIDVAKLGRVAVRFVCFGTRPDQKGGVVPALGHWLDPKGKGVVINLLAGTRTQAERAVDEALPELRMPGESSANRSRDRARWVDSRVSAALDGELERRADNLVTATRPAPGGQLLLGMAFKAPAV